MVGCGGDNRECWRQRTELMEVVTGGVRSGVEGESEGEERGLRVKVAI